MCETEDNVACRMQGAYVIDTTENKHAASATALIVAAGSGSRMNSAVNKIFLPLLDQPILAHTLLSFQQSKTIKDIVLVSREEDVLQCREIAQNNNITKLQKIVPGGATRQDSVLNGLSCISGNSLVAIHDAARALITPSLIDASVCAAMEYRAAALGVKCKDTLKSVDDNGMLCGTVDREHTYHIQTPQVFFCKDIKAAHECAKREGVSVTDDCALIQKYTQIKIKLINSSYDNIKITTQDDIYYAENILLKRG